MEITGLLLISKVIRRMCSIVRRKKKGKNKEGMGEIGHGDLSQCDLWMCLGETRNHDPKTKSLLRK